MDGLAKFSFQNLYFIWVYLVLREPLNMKRVFQKYHCHPFALWHPIQKWISTLSAQCFDIPVHMHQDTWVDCSFTDESLQCIDVCAFKRFQIKLLTNIFPQPHSEATLIIRCKYEEHTWHAMPITHCIYEPYVLSSRHRQVTKGFIWSLHSL